MPPLPSTTPLPVVRVKARTAFRDGKRTLPRLPQTVRRGGPPCAAPSCFRHPLQVVLLSCGALSVASFAGHRCPFPTVTTFPAAHDDGSLQHLSPNSSGHRAVPPARITGNQPVTAVALPDGSQQHGRLGHGGQMSSVRDGRIGYWYTNSRSARGAGRLRGERGVSRSFIFQAQQGHEGERSAAVKCSGISSVRRFRSSANGRIPR